jgi:predicted permease
MTATIDGVVFAFTTAITLVACLLFGLAPSLRAGRVDFVGSLRLAGRGRPRRRVWGMTEPFVVAQVAMSLALVLAATLLVRTLLNAQQHPYGFDQDNVLLVQINPSFGGYQPATVGDLYRRIHDRLVTLPGVERVSFARYAPFSGSRSSTIAVTVEGYEPAPDEKISLETILVGPNYPQTIGMPIVAGRAFDFDDSASAPRVAIVNEAFARRFYSGRSPIGRVLALGPKDDRRHEIVGMLKDAHFRNIREAVAPSVFLPMLQEPTSRILDAEFELRARQDAAILAGPVRDAIAAVDPKVRVGRTRTLRAQVLSTFGPERTAAGFIVTFAGLALFVAAIGLYGVVSHGLARRTSEIGVRLALGAGRVDVVRLVARETLWRLGLGLGIGFLLTQAGSRFLAGQLFGLTSTDVTSAVIAALLLSAVVALTLVRPILRAMRVDPVIALRAE